MKLVFTKKAETDGVGKAGEVAQTEKLQHTLHYLQLHGYVEQVDSPGDAAGRAATPTAFGAVESAPSDGAVKRRK